MSMLQQMPHGNAPQCGGSSTSLANAEFGRYMVFKPISRDNVVSIQVPTGQNGNYQRLGPDGLEPG